jgi:hypothetical protein
MTMAGGNEHFHEQKPGKYVDTAKCHRCGLERKVLRWRRVAGKEVTTWCPNCRDTFKTQAGIPQDAPVSN